MQRIQGCSLIRYSHSFGDPYQNSDKYYAREVTESKAKVKGGQPGDQSVKARESQNLRNWILKTFSNTKYPPRPVKNHLRNHFQLLKSGVSAIATYEMRIYSLGSQQNISSFTYKNSFK